MTLLSIRRTDSLIARDKRIALEHELASANEDAGFRAGMAWAAHVESEYSLQVEDLNASNDD